MSKLLQEENFTLVWPMSIMRYFFAQMHSETLDLISLYLDQQRRSISYQCAKSNSSSNYHSLLRHRIKRDLEVDLEQIPEWHTYSPQELCTSIITLLQNQLSPTYINYQHWLQSNHSMCVQYIFEEQVSLTPDAIAIQFADQVLTYHELNQKANQLARHLQQLKVGTETCVGVSLERSPEAIISFLAILKAGGVYVPLDPHYPSERLRSISEDVHLHVLITQGNFRNQLWQQAIDHICTLSTDWSDFNDYGVGDITSSITPDNLAYIIYTSGSTDQPKGSMIAHRGLVNLAYAQIKAFDIHTHDRVLQFTSANFDVSIGDFVTTLLNGAILCLGNDQNMPLAQELVDVLYNYAVTLVQLPVAVLATLPEAMLPSLQTIVAGGEPCQTELVKRWGRGRHFFNAYGLTETTVCTTLAYCEDGQSPPPIGYPIDNTEALILDHAMKRVSVGEVGELYLGGFMLARGYHQHVALTAEQFVPHPFSTEPGSRLYRTGDLARFLSDGQLEFIGRQDQQIKLRGYRIELEEVAACLRNHATIHDATVIVTGSSSQQKQLVAYLIPSSQASINQAELRKHIECYLPSHMHPSRFFTLDQFPLTPNGKLDRSALPSYTRAHLIQEERLEQSKLKTETEKIIALYWHDNLGIDEIGGNIDFFKHGGNSLLAARLVSWMNQKFNMDVPLRTIFEKSTLSDLANYIDNEKGSAAQTKNSATQPMKQNAGTVPLSFVQQQLWFLQHLEPENPFYNTVGSFICKGTLVPNTLRACMTEIVRRHAILRTLFMAHAGHPPLQRILPPYPFQVPLIDLSALGEPALQQLTIAELLRQEARHIFDLTQGPLLRVHLLRLRSQEHILLINMHHIISDGWSLDLLLDELAQLYTAYEAHQPSPLPELALQYADYALWQQQWLEGTRLQEQLAYWRHQLAEVPALVTFPADHPRPAVQSYHGALHSFQLSPSLSSQLRRLCHQESVTLFMLLLACLQTLLWRYSGQTDLLIGTPIANRTRTEFEPLIGFFVNTLVLRTNVADDPSFRQLLQRVREMTLQAYAHQDLPFEKLVEDLQPERQMQFNPFFQILLALQSDHSLDALSQQLAIAPYSTIDNETSKFDTTFFFREEKTGSIQGSIEYNIELFEAHTISQIAQHLQKLLQSAAENVVQPISRLLLLEQSEILQQCVQWNNTKRSLPALSIQQLFEQQVERSPDAIALVYKEHSLSYRELNTRANQLAHYLKVFSKDATLRVGICMERSVEMIIGLLGVIKVGGTYIPLDPHYPAERLSFILEDAQVTVLLLQEKWKNKFEDYRLHILALDSEWHTISDNPQENQSDAYNTNAPLYVIYTSGSTGQPKGTSIYHHSFVNLLYWYTGEYEIAEKDHLLQFSSFSFDLSQKNFFAPLIVGGRLHLSECASYDHLVILEELQRSEITITNCTPSAIYPILEQSARNGISLHSMRKIFLGGETIRHDQIIDHYRVLPRECQIVNTYGPTECTDIVTSYSLPPLDQEQKEIIPIGKPIWNVQVLVLDQHLQIVPRGCIGELYVGGEGIGAGYLNNSEATQEKFVPHPFPEIPSALLYKTGDLVRYLPDGNLIFIGRIDQQIKLRGLRIELGEIEVYLRQHPSVKDVAVLLQEDANSEQQLVAYVIRDPRHEISAALLGTWMQQQLPTYMQPTVFIQLDRFPLTANGKVDRRALKQASGKRLQYELQPVDQRPPTPVEELLAQFWRHNLGLDVVNKHANFFELGGHSLLATRLISWIQHTFKVNLPLSNVFTTPTLYQLAQQIETQEQSSTAFELSLISTANRNEGSFPLSFAQQRQWFLHYFNQSSPFYNISGAFHVNNVNLSLHLLRACMTEIVRRHAILRTLFMAHAGHPPLQRILPPYPFQVPLIDLSALGEPALQQLTIAELLRQEARHIFDLTQGPLLRVHLLRLRSQEHILLINMHHIISDGWSLDLLLDELAQLYTAYEAHQPSPLPELALQYADYALWQQQWLEGTRLQEQLAYWRHQLAEVPALVTFPADHPRPAVQSYHGALHSFQLSPSLSSQLRRLCHQESVTLFMLLLACLQTLLWRYSGQTDLLIGTPIANRTRTEFEPLIGFFVNTLVLRTNVADDPSFRQLLQRVREMTLQAYAHQDLPFEKLVEDLQPERHLSYTPLFQVMLLLEQKNEEPMLAGSRLQSKAIETDTAMFDLLVAVQEKNQDVDVAFNYRTDLFEPETIAQIALHFQMLLHAVVQQPDQPISCLTLLSSEEQSLLLRLSQPQEYPYPLAPLHLLFEQQVDRTPEAVALCFEQEHLTYQHLENCANRLAATLRHHGVAPDVRVGLCAQRSPELVIGLLAILKAGGAYVPLDPSYPQERLAFLLQDAQVHLLLSQRSLQGQLPACPCPVLWLDDAQHLPAFPVPHRLSLPVSLDQLCYVIYTSGSTGQPKGVLLSHRSVCNRLLWMQEHYPLSSQDAVLQKTPFTFDVSVWEFFWPLLAGARLVLARPEGHRDPGYLRQVIQEQQISTLHFVPSMFQAFLHEPELESSCRSLRHVFCSGEALPLTLQESFFARLGTVPGLHLYNLYGPTEASIEVTAWTCQPQPPHRSVPIGTPIANMEVYVLDEQLQLVPRGAIGELYLGGVGLARGYQQRPALTAERFVPHPWSRHVGERLYRTGDLVRFWADGTLEYLGRRDQQIKVRGFRVELGEIEATLLGHPQVAQAAVLATAAPDQQSGQILAFLVPQANTHQDDPNLSLQQVSHWEKVFDMTFSPDNAITLTDHTLHFGGWNSSYTGRPISQDDMHQWLETTVQRILELKPKNILEIGCGNGLLIFRLMPHIQYYWGSDVSAPALNHIHGNLSPNLASRVHLRQQEAINIAEWELNSIDTIVINSVVQYFPSLDYFLQVLRQALTLLVPGGSIFIGDLRHYGLLHHFHSTVAIAQATEETTIAELRQQINRRLDQEEELLISPSFFWMLPALFPAIDHVEVFLKRGGDNELTSFRYDVLLRVHPTSTSSRSLQWNDWKEEQWTLTRLETTLREQRPDVLALKHIPNARLRFLLLIQSLIEQASGSKQTLALIQSSCTSQSQAQEAVDPESLWKLAEKLSYHIRVSWLPGQDIEQFVAVFERDPTSAPIPLWQSTSQSTSTALQSFVNRPLQM